MWVLVVYLLLLFFFHGDIYYLYDMIYNHNVVKSCFYFYFFYFFLFFFIFIFIYFFLAYAEYCQEPRNYLLI